VRTESAKEEILSESERQTTLIHRAAAGDVEAFSRLVREFQDVAVGYGVAILGDVHAAEDAAQEAFLAMHSRLWQLRDPVAFPAWLRTLVPSVP
jgi:DNA-directed RNA polymerase specialized sigma24 family protein